MQVDWKIDYDKKIAESELIEVKIEETKRTLGHEFKEHKMAIAFEKAPSQRRFFCKITRMDGSLWEDQEILPQYGNALGDIFDEEQWDKK